MNILQAIVYGIIQGLTEFLPISSDAHLIIIPKLLGWQDPSLNFDIALHFGTTVAVIGFFFKDWVALIKAGFTKPSSGSGKIFWWLVAAAVPGGLLGLLLKHFAKDVRNLFLIAWMLIIMGILLYLADRFSPKKYEIKSIGVKRSVLIGLAQVVAMIPGVSRSGITITAGRLCGVKRESAAKFTFLLSTPTILGLCLYDLKDIAGEHIQALPFSLAVVASAIVGALAIKFLLDYIKRKGFGVFMVYRCALGVLLLILLAARVIQ